MLRLLSRPVGDAPLWFWIASGVSSGLYFVLCAVLEIAPMLLSVGSFGIGVFYGILFYFLRDYNPWIPISEMQPRDIEGLIDPDDDEVPNLWLYDARMGVTPGKQILWPQEEKKFGKPPWFWSSYWETYLTNVTHWKRYNWPNRPDGGPA